MPDSQDEARRPGEMAAVSSAIEENLADVHYGRRLAAAGVTTVALDDEGRLVEHRPDGTTDVRPLRA